MITARIKSPYIEIPMVVCDYQHVGLNQVPLPFNQPLEQMLILRYWVILTGKAVQFVLGQLFV